MRIHKPVMLNEVIEYMPKGCSVVMDWTLGHWWHSIAMLEHMRQSWLDNPIVIWVDRDEKMISKAKIQIGENLTKPEKHWVTIVQWSYADFDLIVQESWQQKFDYILIDIWVNMDHFKEADRWFSLKLDWKMDMRYDTSLWTPVYEWLEKANYTTLYNNFTLYTDYTEKYIDRLTKELIIAKNKKPMITTLDFADRAKTVWINDKKLAVIFQSFRILINDELWELDKFLQSFIKYIPSKWRCAVMSYHSWEDRRVKEAFKNYEQQWLWVSLSKHVIKPNRTEVKKNKASRSAKMRVFELN